MQRWSRGRLALGAMSMFRVDCFVKGSMLEVHINS